MTSSWPPAYLYNLWPFSTNVVRGGCYRAVLTQCGLVLTNYGPERPDILSQSGPKTADVIGIDLIGGRYRSLVNSENYESHACLYGLPKKLGLRHPRLE
jgi:hypothetical protein